MGKRADGDPPTSLREGGIVHVGLKVSNADSSRRFYQEILGLDGEPREPGIVYVPSGGDMLILYEPGKGATDFHFGFHVDAPATVDKWKDWLAQNGVSIAEEVVEDKYRSIKFQDPDGHWLEISYETY